MEHKLKFILQGWNGPYGELQNEEDSLDFYRTSYEDEIPKKELEAHLSSLESWAAFAYKTKRLFDVTALIQNNDQPYAALLLNDGNAIVEFIDENNRIYMRYFFSGRFKDGFLFLTDLDYFIYPDDNFYSTSERKDAIMYEFTPEGKLTVTKHLSNGDGTDTVTVDEAAHPIDVGKNWEPYPKLGEYESITRMKRWGEEGDLLIKGIPAVPEGGGPDGTTGRPNRFMFDSYEDPPEG